MMVEQPRQPVSGTVADLEADLVGFDAWLAEHGATLVLPELAATARAALVSVIELEKGRVG